ncbi:hypothetical protein QE152_g39448 [Popillia japonica]|uniref:Uncharacterized protein n=1 Tax=Popillia japonica TaxID=7064 RepID=A0AAW1HU87_POPJA
MPVKPVVEKTTLVLTANAESLLTLMGKKAVEGDSSVPEIGITKRKIEEAKDNIAKSSGVMVAIQGHSCKVCIPLQRMTPITAAIETLPVDQGRNCSRPQIQVPTTPEVSTPTSRKRNRLDDFVNTSFSILHSINSNIAAMNRNFEKLALWIPRKYPKSQIFISGPLGD